MSGDAPFDLHDALREPAAGWAREEFKLAADAGPGEIRRAALARLREASFVPPPAWELAIRMLADPEGRLSETDDAGAAFLVPYEGLLHGQMSRLCREFFELPPDARREAWRRLRAAARFAPAVAAHLDQLEPALDVRLTEPKNPEPRSKWLTEMLCAALRSPPPMRAGIEGLLLSQVKGNTREWKAAIRRIRKTNPSLAVVVAPLLDRIARQAGGAGGGVMGAIREATRAFVGSAGGSLMLLLMCAVLANTMNRSCQQSHYRPPPFPDADKKVIEKKVQEMLERAKKKPQEPPPGVLP